MNPGDELHVALWDAINEVVTASGGKSTTRVARQIAVARVEMRLRKAMRESFDIGADAGIRACIGCHERRQDPAFIEVSQLEGRP